MTDETEMDIEAIVERLEKMEAGFISADRLGAAMIPREAVTALTALSGEIERLKDALKIVRKDITECGVVVFRSSGPSQTTFDYIGDIIGDSVTWEEWEASATKKPAPN